MTPGHDSCKHTCISALTGSRLRCFDFHIKCINYLALGFGELHDFIRVFRSTLNSTLFRHKTLKLVRKNVPGTFSLRILFTVVRMIIVD